MSGATMRKVTRVLANHAAAAMLALWVGCQYTNARTPALDTLLMITMGVWFSAFAISKPAQAEHTKALPVVPDSPKLPPPPLPSPLCTETWVVKRSRGVNARVRVTCTKHLYHGGLHEKADPDDPFMPPLHRWYRTSSGTVVGS